MSPKVYSQLILSYFHNFFRAGQGHAWGPAEEEHFKIPLKSFGIVLVAVLYLPFSGVGGWHFRITSQTLHTI